MAQGGVKRLHKPISTEPVCGVITVPLATYKKKVSIHRVTVGQNKKYLALRQTSTRTFFRLAIWLSQLLLLRLKKVTVIYMYIMCMISPRSFSLPRSIIWFIICADINHGFGSVRGKHGANPGLWLVSKGDRMCLHLMGLGSHPGGRRGVVVFPIASVFREGYELLQLALWLISWLYKRLPLTMIIVKLSVNAIYS